MPIAGMTSKNPRTSIPDIDEQDLLIDELEDDEAVVEDVTETAIEAKYDSNQNQIFIQRNDFLIPNILQMVKNRDVLDLSPNYQRRTRWNDRKRSHLIESLLMNVPIPPIFLYERDLAKYEVMDGQQRLNTIRSFLSNEFKLRDLKTWPELNGRRFVDLPPRIQAGLMRRGLAAVIVLTESGQDELTAMELRQYVFERLNTGGESLNAQEIRNCIFSGNFNDMLVAIARSDLFTKVWGIPPKESHEPQKVSRKLATNRLYATLSDCEIVLRFFALSNLGNFRGGMKRTLDDCMRRNRQLPEAQCKKLAEDYKATLAAAYAIYDKHLFRLFDKANELNGRRSVPLADAILLALVQRKRSWSVLTERRNKVIQKTKDALKSEKTYEILVGRGNTKAAIEERIDVVDFFLGQIVS
ncbi:MAG: DUF262 domain-containing protein [Acidobacteriales bacterium]|nr:DUF262 domain-containing protein [Terriglobales bacterium]